ncbi:hypothetical protein ASE86_14990 [Sphingomonas sp. Leaf33]|uniref:hypothetical protein n=1 Tax=Sphingomonas sp. Leaf33 TaxID=1736215 RepID=UPI0006FDE412|nr:hypothetical protein [Sphingomonas sp. Leaf33]KQN20566.1 hypothetical protein ASE86_14990 [Sphingomonas sp. Leaf33]
MTLSLSLVAATALSMSVPTQDTATPAAPTVTRAPAAAPAAAARFSLDTPVETLVADARAKAVIDGAVPGIAAHPMYEQFKGMSFNQLAPMAPGQLTAETMAKLKTGLDAVK